MTPRLPICQYRNIHVFDEDDVAISSENVQTEEVVLFSSFEDPNPVPKRLPQRCLPIDMDQEFEIRGYTMIFCGIPFMIYSNKYTIGNEQIVYQIDDFQNPDQPITFAIDFIHIDRVWVPSKIISKGAFFIYFELTEVGMFALYDVLKKYFPFLPSIPTKVCSYRSKYILTDACLNWENDFEKICQLLLYLDCAIVHRCQKVEEPYLSARMMRLNSNISFLRPESISEILGLSKCKIIFGIESKLHGLFSSFDISENGKNNQEPERYIALIDRDPKLLDYYHEISFEYADDKVQNVRSNQDDVPYDLNENIATLREKCIIIEKNDLKFELPISRMLRITQRGWTSNYELQDMIKLYMEIYLTDDKQKRRFGLLPVKEIAELLTKHMNNDNFEEIAKDMETTMDTRDYGHDDIAEFHFYRQDYVFIPIVHVNHHFLVVVVNPNGAIQTIHDFPEISTIISITKILIFDSKTDATPDHIDTHKRIYTLVKMFLYFSYYRSSVIAPGIVDDKRYEQISVNVPQQCNAYDCGFYVMKIIEKFFKNPPDMARVANSKKKQQARASFARKGKRKKFLARQKSVIDGGAVFYLNGFRGPDSDLARLCYVCGQQTIQAWNLLVSKISVEKLKKLGEGSFGEVYQTTLTGEQVALKVFSFKEDPTKIYPQVNGGEMILARDIMTELVITQQLSEIGNGSQNMSPNFIGLRRTFVIRGKYPKEFLEAWNKYDQKKGSENTHPSDYCSSSRHYIVMALELGGADLEHYNLEGEKKAISIFSQVALTLAVAEAEIEFEHRDLHWGNILIKSERKKKPLIYKYQGKTIELNHKGVSVRIVDFSLSRILKSNTMVGKDLNADEDLFKGEEGNLQFDTYRAMRAVTKGKWEKFSPKTNCLWLKYLGNILMEKVRTGKAKLKPKRIEELTDFFNKVVEYDSAQDFVFNCESFKTLSNFNIIEN